MINLHIKEFFTQFMFTTQEIVGDIIFISFNNKDRYKDIGLNIEAGHFKALGYDHIGVWVEHPFLVLTSKEEMDKAKINKDDLTDKKIESNFLITWDNIKTIMHYPNRDGYDFPSEFDKKYGFKLKKLHIW